MRICAESAGLFLCLTYINSNFFAGLRTVGFSVGDGFFAGFRIGCFDICREFFGNSLLFVFQL